MNFECSSGESVDDDEYNNGGGNDDGRGDGHGDGHGNDDDATSTATKCCGSITWTSLDGKETVFTRRRGFNEGYPIYESTDLSMWWMWHDNVGHWVVNT